MTDVSQDPAKSALTRLLSYHRLDPQNPVLSADVVQLAIDCGDFDLARKIGMTIPAESRPLALSRNLGITLLALGDPDTAFDHLEVVVTAAPDAVEPRYELAYAAWRSGRAEQALEILSAPSLSGHIGANRLKVRLLHTLNRPVEALEAGEHQLFLEFDSEIAGALSILALDMGDHQKAEHYAKLAPTDGASLVTLGYRALAEDQLDQARDYLSKAIKLKPHSGRAKVALGLVALGSGDYPAAILTLEEAATAWPGISSKAALAWAHSISGNLETALLILEEMGGEAKDDAGTRAAMAFLAGNLSRGQEELARANRLSPNSTSTELAIAIAKLREGALPEGNALLKALLKRLKNEAPRD